MAAIGGAASLVRPIVERRHLGQGWTSRLLQRLLLDLLTQPDSIAVVDAARVEYARRRSRLTRELAAHGVDIPAGDGLNVWIPVADEATALVALASRGIGAAPGAPVRGPSRPAAAPAGDCRAAGRRRRRDRRRGPGSRRRCGCGLDRAPLISHLRPIVGCHDGAVQIAVLGPLEVRTDGGLVDVAGARLRTLLIRLAIAAPAPATVTALVDAVWPDDPPADPANALQSLVSRLRRVLNDADAVVQVPGGYRLQIGEDDVDLRRFTRLARDGRDDLRAGRVREAARRLRDALALWRSDALDAAIERDLALCARLHEQHLDVLADRIEADLRQGQADRADR